MKKRIISELELKTIEIRKPENKNVIYADN